MAQEFIGRANHFIPPTHFYRNDNIMLFWKLVKYILDHVPLV